MTPGPWVDGVRRWGPEDAAACVSHAEDGGWKWDAWPPWAVFKAGPRTRHGTAPSEAEAMAAADAALVEIAAALLVEVVRRERTDVDAPHPVAERLRAERAVVEAAKAWRTATMNLGSTLVETMRDLRDAVDALLALEARDGR